MAEIYVETLIDAPADRVWRVTQDPRAHCRWDARFGRIEPVPGATPARFRYVTAVLPGVEVGGYGMNAGERSRPDGTRTSALRFGSDDSRSLIAAGCGYWRYVPGPDGVRFLTGYSYTTRWGRAGRLADRLFCPMFGWATAWSFDRLRLWLERGIAPERARGNAWRELALRTFAVASVAILVATVTGHGLTIAAALLAAVVIVVVLPPGPDTPAARRCRRRPPDRFAARTPSVLEQL